MGGYVRPNPDIGESTSEDSIKTSTGSIQSFPIAEIKLPVLALFRYNYCNVSRAFVALTCMKFTWDLQAQDEEKTVSGPRT